MYIHLSPVFLCSLYHSSEVGLCWATQIPADIILDALYYPYPAYSSGLIVYKPFLVQAAVNVVVTLLIGVETSNHRFVEELIQVFQPIKAIIEQQKGLLATDPASDEWKNWSSMRHHHAGILSSIFQLARTQHLLQTEIDFRRLGADDTKSIFLMTRKVVTSISGFIKVWDSFRA